MVVLRWTLISTSIRLWAAHPDDLGQTLIASYYSTFLPQFLSNKTEASAAWDVSSLATKGRKASYHEHVNHEMVLERMKRNPAWSGNASPLRFVDYKDLNVMGRAFNDTSAFFNRLPASAEGKVRTPVWALSEMSTGMFLPFVTNSTQIVLNFSLALPAAPLWHMPASGTSGGDLFCKSNGTYRFVNAISFPAAPHVTATATLASSLILKDTSLKCIIYLPLRNTIETLKIGVDRDASLSRDPDFSADGISWRGKKPVVWYGTSIDQGGVATRPGNTYTNILSRAFERIFLNFGFAGNGVMETSVAEYLVQINAALYVIDCLPNMNPATIRQRTSAIVGYIRKFRPLTPILLVAGTDYGDHWLSPSPNEDKRAALKEQYAALIADGVKNIHLFLNENDELFGEDELINPTVGGTHPGTLGHREIATFYTSYLKAFL